MVKRCSSSRALAAEHWLHTNIRRTSSSSVHEAFVGRPGEVWFSCAHLGRDDGRLGQIQRSAQTRRVYVFGGGVYRWPIVISTHPIRVLCRSLNINTNERLVLLSGFRGIFEIIGISHLDAKSSSGARCYFIWHGNSVVSYYTACVRRA